MPRVGNRDQKKLYFLCQYKECQSNKCLCLCMVCLCVNLAMNFLILIECLCVCVCVGGGVRGVGGYGTEEGRGSSYGLIILGCCPQMSREWWTFFWVGVIWVMVGMWISVADHM